MKNCIIYEEGLEKFPISGVILGNLVMVSWIALGTIAVWFISPLAAWFFLVFGILMVWVVLRRLVCVNCYYYGKRCALGWGKWASLFFKQGNTDKFKTSIGLKLAPATYGLLSAVPLVLVVVALFQGVTAAKIVVLVLLFAVSFYSAITSRRKSCTNCKMKLSCSGSIAKNE